MIKLLSKEVDIKDGVGGAFYNLLFESKDWRLSINEKNFEKNWVVKIQGF